MPPRPSNVNGSKAGWCVLLTCTAQRINGGVYSSNYLVAVFATVYRPMTTSVGRDSGLWLTKRRGR